MNPRIKKFFSYYKPYLGMFYRDMLAALTLSAITLAIPLCIRYITKNLEAGTSQIYMMGSVMLALIALYEGGREHRQPCAGG